MFKLWEDVISERDAINEFYEEAEKVKDNYEGIYMNDSYYDYLFVPNTKDANGKINHKISI
ncbi:unnamed protein product [Meloidogyne enterolobii]|uniref:Uncharacterized protein n=2 Tax=Meloidogyne enterolobii TaxID=390850 RepID=A0ACB0ZQV6_MELEN